MSKQYGPQQFKKGFELIKANRNMMYSDNGEQKLAELLEPLGFPDKDSVRGFINFCTTYLIVQTMQ